MVYYKVVFIVLMRFFERVLEITFNFIGTLWTLIWAIFDQPSRKNQIFFEILFAKFEQALSLLKQFFQAQFTHFF